MTEGLRWRMRGGGAGRTRESFFMFLRDLGFKSGESSESSVAEGGLSLGRARSMEGVSTGVSMRREGGGRLLEAIRSTTSVAEQEKGGL